MFKDYLVLDFESKDPYIGLGLGAGWVFSLEVPQTSLFKVLGFSFCWLINNKLREAQYVRIDHAAAKELLQCLLDECGGVIMHNAAYDLGCLEALGIDTKDLVVYDTKIIAQLYDNILDSYSLDSLSKKYLPQNLQKKKNSLVDIVKEHQLLKTPKGKPVNINTKTYDQRAQTYAYQNMDILQDLDFDKFSYYAKQDVISTGNLFLKMVEL